MDSLLQGSLFLKRNWVHDELLLKKRLNDMNNIKQYPQPYSIGIYPEGHRITNKRRILSHQYAKEKNLPILNHVLIPRTKGFNYILKHLPNTITCLYDFTIGYEENGLNLKDMFLRADFTCKKVYISIKRIPINLLNNIDDPSIWLMNNFKKKDDILSYLLKHNKMPNKQINLGHYTHKEWKFKLSCYWLIYTIIFNYINHISTWKIIIILQHYIIIKAWLFNK